MYFGFRKFVLRSMKTHEYIFIPKYDKIHYKIAKKFEKYRKMGECDDRFFCFYLAKNEGL